MPDAPEESLRIYVSAFLCQEVLNENGLLTAVRITNAYTTSPVAVVNADGVSPPEWVHPPLKLHALMLFNCEKPVEFDVRIKCFDPNRVELLPVNPPIRCKIVGGAEGHALNVTINLHTDTPGDCWIEVWIDYQTDTASILATKIPMRIVQGSPLLMHGTQTNVHPSDQSPTPPSAASEPSRS